MPSWNIHIAEAEKLLAHDGSVAALVRDRNAFLFGSVVPDVPVGYMVPDIADPIPYRITHFAESEPIPKPRAHEFWDGYVVPLLHHARLRLMCGDDHHRSGARTRESRALSASL